MRHRMHSKQCCFYETSGAVRTVVVSSLAALNLDASNELNVPRVAQSEVCTPCDFKIKRLQRLISELSARAKGSISTLRTDMRMHLRLCI